MEDHIVIKAVLGEKDKIVDGDRRAIGEKVDGNAAFAGFHIGAVGLLGIDGQGGWVGCIVWARETPFDCVV